MSQKQDNTPLSTHRSEDINRRVGSPDSQTTKERKKRRFDDVINGAIAAAQVTRDAGDSVPLLTPLKASMSGLVNFLETVKDVKRFKEEWQALSKLLGDRIMMLQEQTKDTPATDELREMVLTYQRSLQDIIQEIQPFAIKHKNWLQAAIATKDDMERIKRATQRLDDASQEFSIQLQMHVSKGISDIQSTVRQESETRRVEHSQSLAHILDLREGQQILDSKVTNLGENLNSDQREVKTKLTEAEETLLLKSLETAHMANGDLHDSCMIGTREKILEEARAWMASKDPETPQIFWLTDVAGSGKSTVAKHISGEWKSKGCLAGRFFFSRDAEETRTTKLFFSTIAQQGLSHLGSSVKSAISDGIRNLVGPTSAPLEDQCTELFVRPLNKVSFPSVLVLDALDECDQTASTRLLQTLLIQLPKLPHLKLFLTSRPDKHIVKILDTTKARHGSLRPDEGLNENDVKVFMKEKLASISLPDRQMDLLVRRSRGLFIWASTVCRLIEDFQGDRDEYVNELLEHGPEQMDSIYQRALDQALPPGDQKANRKAYMKILGIIAVTFEPLSAETINEMLKISNAFTIVQHLKSLLDCHQPNDPVRLLHPTFREFLLSSPSVNPYYIDERMYHAMALHSCLDTMAHELHYDICGIFGNLINGNAQFEQSSLNFDNNWSYLMDGPACLRYTPNRLEPHRSNDPQTALHLNQELSLLGIPLHLFYTLRAIPLGVDDDPFQAFL
ncbi:hypothetical protein CPB86DRAFT_486423 [Serendipita vermifera]|nr:hypothetical protein CPB86DRAFT_486423 [Serendipita vermifera]